jgi:hypothetical protein
VALTGGNPEVRQSVRLFLECFISQPIVTADDVEHATSKCGSTLRLSRMAAEGRRRLTVPNGRLAMHDNYTVHRSPRFLYGGSTIHDSNNGARDSADATVALDRCIRILQGSHEP